MDDDGGPVASTSAAAGVEAGEAANAQRAPSIAVTVTDLQIHPHPNQQSHQPQLQQLERADSSPKKRAAVDYDYTSKPSSSSVTSSASTSIATTSTAAVVANATGSNTRSIRRRIDDVTVRLVRACNKQYIFFVKFVKFVCIRVMFCDIRQNCIQSVKLIHLMINKRQKIHYTSFRINVLMFNYFIYIMYTHLYPS